MNDTLGNTVDTSTELEGFRKLSTLGRTQGQLSIIPRSLKAVGYHGLPPGCKTLFPPILQHELLGIPVYLTAGSEAGGGHEEE